jgi:hypothetical protein
VALRLLLYRGEAYNLPRGCPGVRVIAGEAWVAHDGRDSVIGPGHELRLQPGRGTAVVSAVGAATLVLEVLGAERRMSSPRRQRGASPGGSRA